MDFISACFRFWCSKDPSPPEKKEQERQEVETNQPTTSSSPTHLTTTSAPLQKRVSYSPEVLSRSPNAAGRRRAQSLSQGTSKKSVDSGEREQINEALNNFTVRSIQQFMKSRGDIYGGDFGRVKITKAQLEANN